MRLNVAERQAERPTVAHNLRRLMVKRGLTSAYVAQACAMNDRTLRAILRAEHGAHARTIKRLADGLGVDPDELTLGPQLEIAWPTISEQLGRVLIGFARECPSLFARWSPDDIAEISRRLRLLAVE